MRRTPFIALVVTGVLCPAAPALAASGPSGGAAVPEEGGAHYGETPEVHGLASLPRLKSFSLSSRTLSASASFRFAGPHTVRDVRLQLVAVRGNRVVKTLRLGDRVPGRVHRVAVSRTGLAAGSYRLRIAARDLRAAGVSSATTVSVPAARVPTPQPTPAPAVGDHVFPVRGPSTFGGPDARFGTKRSGHTHQGQDVPAADGTPVVAPHAGQVKAVRYQASGAGYYVVLDSAGEDRDYVFMHLRAGSTLVREGQGVTAGQQLAQVGNTGASFGAHLHFEVWVGGGWYTGGHPVDPLPYLRAWAGR